MLTSSPANGITRRNAMKGAATIVAASSAGACIGAGASRAGKTDIAGFEKVPEWINLLHSSEKGNRDYAPRIEGDIPTKLRGSLYRNGPGLFERGNIRIKHLLDGDGMVQRLSFDDSGVRYQNKFVRTRKFNMEEKSGKREFSTWTTRKSNNMFVNAGGGVTESQAGVTVYPVHGKILARDEIGPSYEIDPQTLETIGTVPAGKNLDNVMFKAHLKIDPDSNECFLVGSVFGPRMHVHIAVYEPDLRYKTQFSFVSPRQVYFHDFFLTKNHILLNLHPCQFSPFPFLMGMKSFTESLKWNGQQGNLLAVAPRYGGDPKYFEIGGSFMWHALNAYEQGDEIIADLVAYDEPDHFIGKNALFYNIMDGYDGNAKFLGKIRRYVLNLSTGRVREEIIDEANSEFPMIDLRQTAKRHNVGYFAAGGEYNTFHSGIKRVDYNNGKTEMFDFGDMVQIGEPVFIPAPGGNVDEGWMIAEGIDGNSKTSFFALFDAQTIGKGPIAKIWLNHHMPISFHGAWDAKNFI